MSVFDGPVGTKFYKGKTFPWRGMASSLLPVVLPHHIVQSPEEMPIFAAPGIHDRGATNPSLVCISVIPQGCNMFLWTYSW